MMFLDAIKRKFQKRYRVIVTWEFQRVSPPPLETHPYYYTELIWEWIEDNAEHPVYLCRYNRLNHTPIKSRRIGRDVYELYDSESYSFIRGKEDQRVLFMELEFTSMEDRTLFLLMWSGRVNTVDAIPFIKHSNSVFTDDA